MVIRVVVGVILCVVGLVWIGQGFDLLGGSGMSGHSIWGFIGIIVLIIGLGMLGWASRFRRSQ